MEKCGVVFWGTLAFLYVLLFSVKMSSATNNNDNYDYKEALDKAILFFEGQRSGKLPASQRVHWRGDSALSDGNPEKVDLVGGYYDAGDNVKFGWPMAFSVSLLSWAAVEYRAQISSANQLGHLHNAIRWGTDFILKAHTSPTTLYTQVGDGNSDHQCWERPEDMDTSRALYKITSGSPGTEVAAEAAAALAAASIAFKEDDSSYSSRLLSQSQSLFEFADKYRGSYQGSCPFYCSYSGYQDELLWAASWLYKASGNNKYLNYVSSNKGWSHAVSEFSWDNKFVGAQALLAKEFYGGKKDLEKYKSDIESFVCAVMPGSSSVQIKTTPGGLLYTRDSSNLQYVTTSTMVLSIYANTLNSAHIGGVQCGSTKFSASQIRAFAKSQVDYILGSNPMKTSYMVGFGSKYPTQLHHRGSSIPSLSTHKAKVSCNEGQTVYFPSTKPNPNIHMGALVGGPNSNDQFTDVRSDYSHLEPSTYMNAAFVGSVAALLSLKAEESSLVMQPQINYK
ncbi:endoglucanase 20-like [Humulus lupulus]|uniref:endoglucanase 20-like n=1 Tax=Humulus lupulus TaxID=3486 RepID=UPI002B416D66|nr:endoglucanase 20-like [Humulus lupulus]